MSDQQDNVIEDADESDAAASETQYEEDVTLDDSAQDTYSDTTVNTPTPTIKMRVAPTGEYYLSRREYWLRSLNHAIAEHPESPTNYVLRGELALETRAYEQAISDFKKAIELASLVVETSNWGIVAQVMQDRAHMGLAEAMRKAAKRRKSLRQPEDSVE